jgi:hypothetical protein
MRVRCIWKGEKNLLYISIHYFQNFPVSHRCSKGIHYLPATAATIYSLFSANFLRFTLVVIFIIFKILGVSSLQLYSYYFQNFLCTARRVSTIFKFSLRLFTEAYLHYFQNFLCVRCSYIH